MKLSDEEIADILSRAISCAKTVKSPVHRAVLASKIALASSKLQHSRTAEHLLENLLEDSCTLKLLDQALIILELAYAYGSIGNEEQATELFSKGCSLAKNVTGDEKYGILYKAAELLCELGRYTDANAIAIAIKPRVYRDTVLTVIVRSHLKNGNIEMAATTALETDMRPPITVEILLSVLERKEMSETERALIERLLL
jgi:tetratricopeptide (TPR) repeat protein